MILKRIFVVLLIGLMIRFIGSKKVTEAVADVITVEHDSNEPVMIQGPDLVLAHQLRNAPVSKREELKRRAEAGLPLYDEPKKTREEHKEPEIVLREDAPVAEPASEPEETTEDSAPETENDLSEEPAIELREDTPAVETPKDAANEPEEQKEQGE